MSNAPTAAKSLPPPPDRPSPFTEPLSRESWSADPWAKALFTFSHKVETKPRFRQHKLPQRTTGTGDLRNPESTSYTYSLADTAPQLANPMEPLRDRDRIALRGFFAHDQMVAIEADILHRLSYLVPEPAWEVEPYEFLREFL